MFICSDCLHTFENAAFYQGENTFLGYGTHECPFCHSENIGEAKECAICREDMPEKDWYDGHHMCVNCRRETLEEYAKFKRSKRMEFLAKFASFQIEFIEEEYPDEQ